MATCEVNINNGVPVVKTYPSLMREIMVYTKFNLEQALDLYGLSLTEDFKNLGIEKPTLANILAFNEMDYIADSDVLTADDRNDILQLSLNSRKMDDFRERFIEVFTVDGMFGIDINRLRNSNLFTDSDILYLSDEDNIERLKQLYYKLNSTNEKISTIQSNVIIKNDLFDKFNPDEFLQNSNNNYVGLSTAEEIWDKANEIGDEIILNNPDLIPVILNEVSDKQEVVQYETDEYTGDVVKKQSNNILTSLEQTFDTSQNVGVLLQQLQFIRELSVEQYAADLPLISKYIENIEKQALLTGIDISTLSDVIGDRTYDETIEFLDSIYNFLFDVQTENTESIEESMNIFAETYNQYFQVEPEYRKTIIDKIEKPGVFLHLETNRTEEDLFKSHSILKLSDNLYQKISDNNTLDELYNILLRNPQLLPKSTLSVSDIKLNQDIMLEDLDKYISKEAKDYLTESSDVDTIKKIVAYKLISGIETKIEETAITDIGDINPHDFLIDFNKTILNNPVLKKIFYISNRGLEAKHLIGDYTNQLIKNELSERQYDDLVKYSKLSGNSSLSYLTGQGVENGDTNMRDYYANNMSLLPQYSQDYSRNNGYIVTNSTEDFIKINSELYENVAPNIYAKVERNSRYRSYNLTAPEYDNSITPDIKMQEGGKIKVKKVNNLNDPEVEFC